MMGTSAVLERGAMGRENPCSPFVRAFPIRKRHSKVNLRYFEFIAIISPGLIFQLLANFPGIEFLKTLLIQEPI